MITKGHIRSLKKELTCFHRSFKVCFLHHGFHDWYTELTLAVWRQVTVSKCVTQSVMKHEKYVKHRWCNITVNFKKLYPFLRKLSSKKLKGRSVFRTW